MAQDDSLMPISSQGEAGNRCSTFCHTVESSLVTRGTFTGVGESATIGNALVRIAGRTSNGAGYVVHVGARP